MKKIFLIAAAALTLGLTACEPEEITPVIDNGGEGNTEARVKTTSDLIGTEWNYTLAEENVIDIFVDDSNVLIMPEVSFGLTFDAQYAHISFPESAEAYTISADGLTMEEIEGIDFEYSYDGATHTGYLVGSAIDEEGNEVPANIDFTYDDATDVITFVLPFYNPMDEENPYSVTIAFNRVEPTAAE